MSFFRFKGFELKNDKSAFKINTDGVLLAAWVDLSVSNNVLDIGTGTGVISIISKLSFPHIKIKGIDIDKNSVDEAQFNVSHNNLSDILFEQVDLRDCLDRSLDFDHIICNPPYFQNSTPSKATELTTAKHNHSLQLSNLLKAASLMIHPRSKFSIILPLSEAELFKDEMLRSGFGLRHALEYSGRKGKPVIRRLMEFERSYSDEPDLRSIYLFEDEHRTKSREYDELVSDLYL